MDPSVDLGIEVRCLQHKCKLSTLQAEAVSDLIQTKCGGKKPNLRKADRVMTNESGVQKIPLHGCVGQGCQHVYGPRYKRVRCPDCNHPRYKGNGKTPNEVTYYFPIRERLKALLQLPNFRKLLQVNVFD